MSSLLIIFDYKITEFITTTYTPKIIKKSSLETENIVKSANYDYSLVTSSNTVSSLTAKLSSKDIEKRRIGIITQPEAKVASIITAGLDPVDLNLAVGTVSPDQRMGERNYPLAGHHVPQSEWSLFSGIYYHGNIGHNVYLTDLEKVYHYKVTNLRFVEETETEILDLDRYLLGLDKTTKGKPQLTLITCDVTGSKRLIQFAELEKVYNIDKDAIPKEAIEGFERAADYTWGK